MENMLQMAPNGTLEVFVLLIQTLPTFWAGRIWISRIYLFLNFRIPNFWISRFPDFQIPRFPDSQGTSFPDSQISRRSRRPPAPPPAANNFSDPNLTPSPTHHEIIDSLSGRSELGGPSRKLFRVASCVRALGVYG